MEVKGSVIVNKQGFILRNHTTVHSECVDRFLKDKEKALLSMTLTDEEPYKTDNQRAYIFGEIGVKALIGYKRWGRSIKTKEMAVDMLMIDTNHVDAIKDADGNTIATIPKRISSGRVSWVSEFIEDAIVFIQVEMGLDVSTPEDYFRGKTIKGA